MTITEKLESAERRIAELENIVQIQANQIERLMDACDIEIVRRSMATVRLELWEAVFSKYPSLLANGRKTVKTQSVIDDFRKCEKVQWGATAAPAATPAAALAPVSANWPGRACPWLTAKLLSPVPAKVLPPGSLGASL